MKPCLIIFSSILLIQTCDFQKAENIPFSSAQIPEGAISRIDFEKDIKPIFVKNCSPCHFPGGKMYERLPFDKDTTIVNHSASILKRIKNTEENALIKEFISQNKSEAVSKTVITIPPLAGEASTLVDQLRIKQIASVVPPSQ